MQLLCPCRQILTYIFGIKFVSLVAQHKLPLSCRLCFALSRSQKEQVLFRLEDVITTRCCKVVLEFVQHAAGCVLA